tara:strand:- start:13064 stop:15889 length:2826 start_codon:yes stop_codon:yes gene_type:complete
MRLLVSAAIFLSATCSPVGAVDFATDIKPVLEAKCLSCHNPNNPKGDLSLATLAEMRSYGEDLVTPGNHRDSLLHQVVISLDGDEPEMPKKGDPLTQDQAALLAEWIDAGAPWPDQLVLKEASKADRSWWAYQPLADPEFETIDAHIDAALQKQGLKRNPRADRPDLIRRVYYDVTGLPPTPEEVQAFATSADPQAWEKLVDELLASPRYGERWGRHWLDVVRFGESKGFERNVILNNIWPFRDFVIRSINEDKPFDQFILEHLAGDVVGKGQPEVEVGTTFLVAGPYDDVGNQDAKAKKIIRANTLDDMITATGSAFLGMTINCAKCHDHKFDPIQQADYYRLRAALEGVQQGQRVLATAEQRNDFAAKTQPLKEREALLKKQIRERENAIVARSTKNPETLPTVTRPKVARTGTEDRFPPLLAQAVRLVPYSNDTDPLRNGIRLDEFEVWTDEAEPRNVALRANGGVAEAAGRAVEDSDDNAKNAYGPSLVNDGEFGKRWFSAGDHRLTIRFAKPERIHRVVYSSDRPGELPNHRKMVFVGEYALQASEDGKTWKTVSESWDREPINPTFLRQRQLRFATTEAEKQEIATLRRELAQVTSQLNRIQPLSTVWAGTFKQPTEPTFLAIGGDPNKPADEIVPASFSTLEQIVDPYELSSQTPEADRRLALAKWITNPRNALTLRVLANRVWHYHFGTGIVATPSDFGYMGSPPSHPKLLDYLARRLKENGWRWKPLHREILLSQTYQQSATYREDAAKLDAESRLLWRFPPRRLSAEEIRDTILTVSNKLDLTMGGPGFRLYKFTQDNVCTYFPLDEHGPETWRRAVYHQNPRAATMDLLTEFDCPDPAFATPRRASTTTPLQALTLMNHSFTMEMSGHFAERLQQHSNTTQEQVGHAFSLAFGRSPTDEEAQNAAALIHEHGLTAFSRALLNSNEFIYLR